MSVLENSSFVVGGILFQACAVTMIKLGGGLCSLV